MFGGISVSSAGLEFECVGSEKRLLQCPSNATTEECGTFQKAAVLCLGMWLLDTKLYIAFHLK